MYEDQTYPDYEASVIVVTAGTGFAVAVSVEAIVALNPMNLKNIMSMWLFLKIILETILDES